MATRKNGNTTNNATTANLGFEAKLWAAADALRNNVSAAEYKHVGLGYIFLKYISDAFETKRAELASQKVQGVDVLANTPLNDSDSRAELLRHHERWCYSVQEYVQLTERNVGVLALYRVLRDGKLKRLRRLPHFSDVFPVGSDELGQLIAEAA